MAIIVCPLSHATALARARNASHVVSLLDPGTPFPLIHGLPDERCLRVAVHDIEAHADGLDAPGESHVDEILRFVTRWDAAQPILIHCYAGISRSTATAFITACARNPGADEAQIAMALRTASPSASPNRRFVALADTALGRKGRMRDAIDAIGRGASWHEIGEAEPFSMGARFT